MAPGTILRRTAIGAGIAAALSVAVGAWGWWVQPAVIVVPLRRLAQVQFGVDPRVVEVAGHPWPYLESGPADGPPMLFLHGFGTSKDAMMQMAAEFGRRGWRTVAPDLPGFGEHPAHGDEPHDAGFYARGIGAFMDAVGMPRATVVGTSMGGALACELAIASPARAEALLLLSPAGVEPPVRNAFMRRVDAGENPLDIASDADFDRVMASVFARPPVVPAPYRRWFVDSALARRESTLRIADALKPFLMDGLRGRLGTVRVPVLVVYGSSDAVTDPSMMDVFAAELPHVRTALVPGAGHVTFADDFPRTIREMAGFLEEAGIGRFRAPPGR